MLLLDTFYILNSSPCKYPGLETERDLSKAFLIYKLKPQLSKLCGLAAKLRYFFGGNNSITSFELTSNLIFSMFFLRMAAAITFEEECAQVPLVLKKDGFSPQTC